MNTKNIFPKLSRTTFSYSAAIFTALAGALVLIGWHWLNYNQKSC